MAYLYALEGKTRPAIYAISQHVSKGQKYKAHRKNYVPYNFSQVPYNFSQVPYNFQQVPYNFQQVPYNFSQMPYFFCNNIGIAPCQGFNEAEGIARSLGFAQNTSLNIFSDLSSGMPSR